MISARDFQFEISTSSITKPDDYKPGEYVLTVTKDNARFYWGSKEQTSNEWCVVLYTSGTLVLKKDSGGMYYHLCLEECKKPTLTFDNDKNTIVFNKKNKLCFFNKADYELTKNLLNMHY